ncbi:MAG: class I SAM-dependent methyltransferase [Chloroflexi bacterium]|nr:class I SAM-dependent methyltransferase [Chloroflexota bacterium]
MSAAGQSLGDALERRIAEHLRGLVLDAGAGRLAHRPSVLQSPNVRRYVSIDYVASHPELGAVADLLAGLPFADETFDCVVCSQVLEHVAEPRTALAEIARVLTPDGLLLLSVPHLSFVHGAPEDYYRYTPYGVAHLLRRAGLVPVSVTVAGGLLSLLSTPTSMGMLLAADIAGFSSPLRALASSLNRSLVAGSRWLEARLDPNGLFALNVVAVAQKNAVN